MRPVRNRRVAIGLFFTGEPPWWFRNRVARAIAMPVHRRRAIRRMRRNPPSPPARTRDQTGPAPELIRVVPVARRVDFEGGHWWITALTVWDDRVGVEAAVWDDTWSFDASDSFGSGHGGPRFHWRMLLEDEAATPYSPKGGGGSSAGHWQRVASEFEPSPPADITAVTIALSRRAWPAANGKVAADPAEVARVTIEIE